MFGISPKIPYVLLKYLGGQQNYLWKQVMLFKPKIANETCVQEHAIRTNT